MSSAAQYLDTEWTLASLVAACVLASAALAALQLAMSEREHGGSVAPMVALSAVFEYMAADELFELHERFDVWFGMPGAALFAPVMVIAFGSWFLTRRRLSGRSGLLFDLAAAAWVASQILELVGHLPIGSTASVWLVFPEELGEFAGSTLFAASLLMAADPVLDGMAHFGRRRGLKTVGSG